MKSNFLHLIISLSLLISCSKKNENPYQKNLNNIENEISEKLIYDFTNEIIPQNENSEFCKNVIDRMTFIDVKGDSVFIERVKSEISKEDFDFIRKQYAESINFKWKNKFENRQIIKLDTTINNTKEFDEFWNETLEKYNCISQISMPIFNKEKNLAIIEISYYCGFLCAAGGTYIYKLDENNKWILYKTIDDWIS